MLFAKLFFVLASIFVFSMVLDRPVQAQLQGMDINRYCVEQGFESALLIGQTVNDWYCQDIDEASYSISMDAVCVDQYGEGWTAHYVAVDQPYSWHCSVWCTIMPKVGKFEWQETKARPSLRVLGPEPMIVDLAAGKEHRIFFKDQQVGPGIWVGNTGSIYGITQWEINRSWIRSHKNWRVRRFWLIQYRTAQGTCPYTASFRWNQG